MKYKATLLTILFSTFICNTALAQATFALDNFEPQLGIDAPVFDAQGQPLEGPGYQAELWGSASSDSLAPALDIVYGNQRVMAAFGIDGYFVGGSAWLSIVDVAPASYAWLQVRAWDARLGGTYEEVEALGIGGYGESLLFYAEGNDPFREPPETPAPLIGLQSFSLRPIVPEPSAFALVVMGVIAVLMFRGRR